MYIIHFLYTTTPVSCVCTLFCNTTVQLCQWTQQKMSKLDS